jgi:hypothetical protein
VARMLTSGRGAGVEIVLKEFLARFHTSRNARAVGCGRTIGWAVGWAIGRKPVRHIGKILISGALQKYPSLLQLRRVSLAGSLGKVAAREVSLDDSNECDRRDARAANPTVGGFRRNEPLLGVV